MILGQYLKKLRVKMILITASPADIEYEMCIFLDRKGVKMMMTDPYGQKINSVNAKLKYDGLNVSSLCDTTDESQHKVGINYTYRCYSFTNVLVNNAGLHYLSTSEIMEPIPLNLLTTSSNMVLPDTQIDVFYES